MSGGSSEEKTLPPSKKKLDDARKKGQVPHSKDLVGAVTFGAGGAAAWVGTGALFASGAAMLDAAGHVAGLGLGPGLRAMGPVLGDAFMRTAAPVLAAVVAAAVLANLLVLRGAVFSVDPVTPKASNVNPAEGFKRLFKAKQLVELVKGVLKLVLLLTALVLVLWGGLRPLAAAPGCGVGCVIGAAKALALALLVASGLVFAAAGGMDVLLQRWLFTRDQRMGVSEQKRERKEQDGDPHVKAERRRLVREAAHAPARLGAAQASLMVHDGAGAVVGLRFVQPDMPVPMVVCRAQGPQGREMLAAAAGRGLPVTQHGGLTQALLKGSPPGAWIPESTYSMAAMVLAQHGLV